LCFQYSAALTAWVRNATTVNLAVHLGQTKRTPRAEPLLGISNSSPSVKVHAFAPNRMAGTNLKNSRSDARFQHCPSQAAGVFGVKSATKTFNPGIGGGPCTRFRGGLDWLFESYTGSISVFAADRMS